VIWLEVQIYLDWMRMIVVKVMGEEFS